jgi:hypothetical protein
MFFTFFIYFFWFFLYFFLVPTGKRLHSQLSSAGSDALGSLIPCPSSSPGVKTCSSPTLTKAGVSMADIYPEHAATKFRMPKKTYSHTPGLLS